MKLIVALVAAVVAIPAAQAYKNPTPGRSLVLQIPGMHRAKMHRNVVYERSPRLRMDVYRPRNARGALPAVLLGGPPGFDKDTGQKIGWAQLIAASGLVAVAFEIRSDHSQQSPAAPSHDVAAAIAYVRAHSRTLAIDPSRLCTLGFSIGTAPWHLWATMRDPQPWLRCNVVYYGPLDFQSAAFPIDRSLVGEYSALTYLRRDPARIPPMLVVKADRDENEGINESIERFEAAARELHADVRVLTNPTAAHGFDLGPRTARTRAIIRETLRFLQARLAKPLVERDDCLSATERASAVRFFAADDTRLIGVELGGGPKGVLLAHQGGGAPPNLCAWMSYARHLVAAGYHVLALDHRGFGSSAQSPIDTNFRSVDLDVLSAVEVLRRHGVRSLVLAGASLGGAAVLGAAPQIGPAVQGVISFAAPEDFGSVDAMAAVKVSTIPSLFVSAVDDDLAETARAFYAASPAPDKQLLIVPGFEHGAPVLEDAGTQAFVDAWIAAHSG